MKLNRTLVASLFLTQMGCSLFGMSGVEESRYTVVSKNKKKEIRKYEKMIVASTIVTGEYKDAQNKAFRVLAGYIFGKNKSKPEIAMTAPVQQAKSEKVAMTAPVRVSEEISMTAPVQVSKAGESDKVWKMSFMMPSKYKRIQDLPEPESDKITFEEIPEKYMAAIRFTWLTSEKKNLRKSKELLKWLEREAKYSARSKPTYAGYDPPWTIPFLRRQEILVEVDPIEVSQ